jgi:hypothetical protein
MRFGGEEVPVAAYPMMAKPAQMIRRAPEKYFSALLNMCRLKLLPWW